MFADDAWAWHARELGAWYWDDLAQPTSKACIAFAGGMSTPTLVVHGALDYRVPDAQGSPTTTRWLAAAASMRGGSCGSPTRTTDPEAAQQPPVVRRAGLAAPARPGPGDGEVSKEGREGRGETEHEGHEGHQGRV
ncbi:MAG: hypothetical protein U1F49_19150 [Rubrivivax sp.]